MNQIWIIIANDFGYSEVRAVFHNEQVAIARARELAASESKKRIPEYEFIIERHTLDADGSSTGYKVVEYLGSDERCSPRFSMVASLGCATQAIAPSKLPYSLE